MQNSCYTINNVCILLDDMIVFDLVHLFAIIANIKIAIIKIMRREEKKGKIILKVYAKLKP